MRLPENLARLMPDVAADARSDAAGALEWVGMSGIELPVRLGGDEALVERARVAAYVNLHRADARGIHMSRLYRHVERAVTSEPLSPCVLRRVLKEFIDSHAELSDRALLRLELDHLVRRRALVSDNAGWRAYPVAISGTLDRGAFALELAFEVLYSSTCPASAALARQLIQERFAADFAQRTPTYQEIHAWLGTEHAICATPHSQRSAASVRVRLAPSFAAFPVVELIDRVEAALATPVQTAVKREDEQAFARLNAANLMFCEDAARRIQATLDADERVHDFWIRAAHLESLHPHDAVAFAVKGVENGYVALP
jgi:GTP cyclohydrolase I